ncbi:IS3 family transposase [Aquisalimonas sp.]|uniref:IS3 family transposase n=1 Tax=Aquisalimonas sp. TaxID=1872621 RepID=UPI0034531686
MQHVQKRHGLSQRRACTILGQHRSTQRYLPTRPEQDAALVAELRRLSRRHKAWGYKMAYKHLRRKGWKINRKRVERVWREAGLTARHVKRRSGKKASGSADNAIWNLPAERPNHVWACDFKTERLANGRPYRILNVIDEYTRRSLGRVVAHSIGARRVQQELTRLFRAHGRPELFRTDNGREFIAESLVQWLSDRGVTAIPVEKASPQQNGLVESFHRTMGRQLLDWERFETLLEAKAVIDDWATNYNSGHYHQALGDLTPNEFHQACLTALREGHPLPLPQTRTRTPKPKTARMDVHK